MQLTIFGSTGGTGRQLVEQALAAGHHVTAIAREPKSLSARHANLTVVQGDVLEPTLLKAGMVHADAVLSALGTRDMKHPTTVYSQGTTAIAKAMASLEISRLIAISAIPLTPRDQKSVLERLVVHPMLYRFFGGGYRDMQEMEARIGQTDLEWTIFRPSRLTDGAKTGSYRTASSGPLRRAWSISRADLASAMLESVTDVDTRRQLLAIAH